MSKQKKKIKPEHNWRFKTVEQLEKVVWSDPKGKDATNLVTKCHALRKKVLNDFTVEDLRLMIGQAIGLDYLIPLAIEVLTDDLFAEGDLYEGDLLKRVLTIEPKFWITHHEYWIEIKKLITGWEDELAAQKISTVNFKLKR